MRLDSRGTIVVPLGHTRLVLRIHSVGDDTLISLRNVSMYDDAKLYDAAEIAFAITHAASLLFAFEYAAHDLIC